MFQVVSDAMLAELKQCFMEAYDDNQDGKIDIREVTFQFNLFFLKKTFNFFFGTWTSIDSSFSALSKILWARVDSVKRSPANRLKVTIEGTN